MAEENSKYPQNGFPNASNSVWAFGSGKITVIRLTITRHKTRLELFLIQKTCVKFLILGKRNKSRRLRRPRAEVLQLGDGEEDRCDGYLRHWEAGSLLQTLRRLRLSTRSRRDAHPILGNWYWRSILRPLQRGGTFESSPDWERHWWNWELVAKSSSELQYAREGF